MNEILEFLSKRQHIRKINSQIREHNSVQGYS